MRLAAGAFPYAQTPRFGNPLDRNTARLTLVHGVVGYPVTRELTLGAGVSSLTATTYGSVPPSTYRATVTGARIAAAVELPVGTASRLTLTAGGMPPANGTLELNPGIAGARRLSDPLHVGSADAAVVYAVHPDARLSIGYGVRYLFIATNYAASGTTFERINMAVPFVQLTLRIGGG